MIEQKILQFLNKIGQGHLAEGLASWSEEEKLTFWNQLSKYPSDLLTKQREALFKKETNLAEEEIHPPQAGELSGKETRIVLGKELVQKGKLGCLVLAGGQATRLKISLPKALYPVTPIRKKSLIQYLCEKTKAASIEAKRDLYLAILVSPLNEKEISSFLEKNAYFGLKKEQISLLCQDLLPLLDEQGNWMLEEKGKLLEGPDGNGRAFEVFMRKGVGKFWKEQGITDVNVVLIDNPLADPFDAELCAYRTEKNVDVAVKTICRKTPEEKVGVLASYKGKLKVIEYSSYQKECMFQKEETGGFSFPYASIGLFCFRLSFLEELYQKSFSLPWHVAHKKAIVFTKEAKHLINISKLECFLFDLFAFANKTGILVYPREEVFAPLKNAEGEDSPETVRNALLENDKRVFTKLSGIFPENREFELACQFFYPTAQLKKTWKGKKLPHQDYIEPS